MKYINTAMDWLFGCHHTNLTRVFTIRGRSYKVCCDCGHEFNYSLETMSIAPRRSMRREAPCRLAQFGSAR